jgi:hypothetical protein
VLAGLVALQHQAVLIKYLKSNSTYSNLGSTLILPASAVRAFSIEEDTIVAPIAYG